MKSKKTYGWCLIPPTIMCRTDLSQSEKLLIGRIIGLLNPEGYCFASNKWLGEQIGLTKDRTSKLIANLHKHKYIQIEFERNEKGHITKRKIYPVFDEGVWSKTTIGIVENDYRGIGENDYRGIGENDYYSIRDKSNRDKSNRSRCDAPQKERFLENVYLSIKEKENLNSLLTEEKANEYITRLNDYIHQIGVAKANAKYKSHYHVILNWYRRDEAEIKKRLTIAEKLKKQKEEKEDERFSFLKKYEEAGGSL